MHPRLHLSIAAAVSLLILINAAGAFTIPATDVIQRVQSGEPVDYDGVNVSGMLDLAKLDPPLVRAPFSMVNCTIPDADFHGVTFDDIADFSGSIFGNATFTSSAFSSYAIFYDAEFLKNVSFEEASFSKDASFYLTHFHGTANMNYTQFKSYAYFSESDFENSTYFSDSVLQEFTDFDSTRFGGDAVFFNTDFVDGAGFLNCSFKGYSHFGMAKFSGYTSFGGSKFEDVAFFSLARFGNAAYFGDVMFQDETIFGLAQLDGIASFINASFAGSLNLKSSRINTILLENATFSADSKINLKGAEFSRFTAPWRTIRGRIVYDGASYLALVKNYQDLEWFEDSDDCYYDYRKESQARKPWGWSKLIDCLAWLTCGYGVRPGYTLFWSLLLMILFGTIFYTGKGIVRTSKPQSKDETGTDVNPDRSKVEEDPALKTNHPPSFRDCLYFSALIFISTGPIDYLPIGRYRYFVIMEGLLGWLFLALMLVSLGKVMIR